MDYGKAEERTEVSGNHFEGQNTASPTDVKQVAHELGQLDKTVEGLLADAELLTSRLGPVLNPSMVSTPALAGNPQEEMAPVAAAIHNQTVRLWKLSAMVNEAAQRLEL